MNRYYLRTLALLILLFAGGPLQAAKRTIHIVTGPKAPKIERLAANEMAKQLRRLFFAHVNVSSAKPNAKNIVLLGSPTTNKHIPKDQWRKVSDQGLVIRHTKSGLIVGGGSPRATLWAAYELGHRLGIRYLLRSDIFPNTPLSLDKLKLDVVMEPTLKVRTWRTVNDFAFGPESWGLKEHQVVIRQLAKLKFNRLMLSFYPWQPFVHYEFNGVKKSSALLWFGDKYRVDGDIPGRVVFGGAKFFNNPDFVGKTTYKSRIAAGKKHIRGIIKAAQELGIEVGISISPLEFPKEFAKAMPGGRVRNQWYLPVLAIPGKNQKPNDKLLRDLVRTKIRAYLETYPTIDQLYFTLPEFPDWNQHGEAAFKALSQAGTIGGLSYKKLLGAAKTRNLIARGKRGVDALKGNLVGLSFIKSVVSDPQVLKTKKGRVQLILTAVDPALFPVLEKVIPENAETLHFIDYTARRIAENGKLLSQVPAKRVPSSLILTLADDNIGTMSQVTTSDIDTSLKRMIKRGWSGFSTRYWIPGELDPTVHYLSRVSYDGKVTPKSDFYDLMVPLTSNKSATDRLWKAWEHLESATRVIDKNNLGFGFPGKTMIMKYYNGNAEPKWWKTANDHFTKSMIELYRAGGAIHSRSRDLIFYYSKRGEFNVYYMNAVAAVKAAGIAKKAGKLEKTVEHLEKAVDELHNAITTIGDIANGQSDRGLIAVLAKYAYRPVVKEYEKQADKLDAQDK